MDYWQLDKKQIQLDDGDSDLILCWVSGLPPVSWLNENRTPDQVALWNDTRRYFQFLYAELKSCFSGEARPAYPNAEIKTFFKREATRYLALYDVIREGWEPIVNAAAGLDAFGIALPASKPGELLLKIIESDCKAHLREAEEYSEFRPRKLYQLLQDQRKIETLKNSPNLSPKDLQKIQAVEARTRSLVQHLKGGAVLRGFCLAVCRESRDRDIKESLKTYDRLVVQLEQSALRHFHPSKRVHGYTWSKGFKKTS